MVSSRCTRFLFGWSYDHTSCALEAPTVTPTLEPLRSGGNSPNEQIPGWPATPITQRHPASFARSGQARGRRSARDGRAERAGAGRTCHACRVPEPFTDMLRGGHPNSLGRTAEAVDEVLKDRTRLPELFAAITDPDEVVRLRVGDALEKVCREQPGWFVARVDRLLGELGQIGQPSVQWHVARCCNTSVASFR
jgi:hypothetical protein